MFIYLYIYLVYIFVCRYVCICVCLYIFIHICSLGMWLRSHLIDEGEGGASEGKSDHDVVDDGNRGNCICIRIVFYHEMNTHIYIYISIYV
jgi:hypothetical protein